MLCIQTGSTLPPPLPRELGLPHAGEHTTIKITSLHFYTPSNISSLSVLFFSPICISPPLGTGGSHFKTFSPGFYLYVLSF